MTSLRRVAAWLVLASFIAIQGVGLFDPRHESLLDDAACLAQSGVYVTGTHHAFGAQFERTIAAAPLEHCPFCHLQRALSHARPANASVAVAAPTPSVREANTALALASGVLTSFVPRGPPVSL